VYQQGCSLRVDHYKNLLLKVYWSAEQNAFQKDGLRCILNQKMKIFLQSWAYFYFSDKNNTFFGNSYILFGGEGKIGPCRVIIKFKIGPPTAISMESSRRAHSIGIAVCGLTWKTSKNAAWPRFTFPTKFVQMFPNHKLFSLLLQVKIILKR